MKDQNLPAIIHILQETAAVTKLVNAFFKDEAKTTVWLNTENPLLGNQQPMEMIFSGRAAKLIKFIKGRTFQCQTDSTKVV